MPADPLDGMSRDAKVVLFVIGSIEMELMPRGLMDGPKRLTPEGQVAYDALVASGFKTTEDEIAWATAALCEASEDA